MSTPFNATRMAQSTFGAQLLSLEGAPVLAAAGDASSLSALGHGARAAAAGDGCRVMLGPEGCAALVWFDGQRFRFAIGTTAEGDLSPGEQRLRPGTWYRADKTGQMVEVPA